jgi:putative FmdB family regulatory protein
MPLYEYSCRRCRCSFDVLRDAAERDDGAQCPDCASTDAIRQWSRFSITGDATGSSPPASESSLASAQLPPHDGPVLKDCRCENCHIGVDIGPGGVVRSEGLVLRGNNIGINNEGGYFDGPDTKFE